MLVSRIEFLRGNHSIQTVVSQANFGGSQASLVAHKLEGTLKTAHIGVWQRYLLAIVVRMQAYDTGSESAVAVAGRRLVLATAQLS